MSFIRDMLNTTEKAITRKVVEGKVQSFINNFSSQMTATNDNADVINEKITQSTGIIAELVDITFDTFVSGFKGLNTIVTDTLENEADTITNIISNNKDHIVTIITALKMMDNNNNKEQVSYLTKAFAQPVKQFLNDDFVNLMDTVGERRIQPKSIELAGIWGITHKWYILDEDTGEQIEVSEENFKLYSKQYRKDNGYWYQTDSYLKTYQSTVENYEHAIATGRRTK